MAGDKKQNQEQNFFNEDGSPTGTLLFGMIAASLFLPPMLLNGVFPRLFGESSLSSSLTFTWFSTVIVFLANIRFAMKLRKEDEERKFLNYIATGCSLWMMLHFGTVPEGMFGDAFKESGLNLAVVSYVIALVLTLVVCAIKLGTRWRDGSLLYKVSYCLISGLSLSILLYYAFHQSMFFTAA